MDKGNELCYGLSTAYVIWPIVAVREHKCYSGQDKV